MDFIGRLNAYSQYPGSRPLVLHNGRPGSVGGANQSPPRQHRTGRGRGRGRGRGQGRHDGVADATGSPVSPSSSIQGTAINWEQNRASEVAVIAQDSEYVQLMCSLVIAAPVLRKSGYILGQLTPSDLHYKQRCLRCSRAMYKRRSERHEAKRRDAKQRRKDDSAAAVEENGTVLTDGKAKVRDSGKGGGSGSGQIGQDEEVDSNNQAPIFRCKFHDGRIENKRWTCCAKSTLSKPCQQSADHTAREYGPGELEKFWQFFTTPTPDDSPDARVAVALDCEMGVEETGESELIRLSAVDYFTGEVLVDSLVYPDVRIVNYVPMFSGVRRQDMEAARAQGKCIHGRDRARAELCRFVGPETILVGHGANSDLTALRLLHPFVLDTREIEMDFRRRALAARLKARPKRPESENAEQQSQEATEEVREGGVSLKALALEYLGRHIQGRWHDSLEDTLATRDILHWQLTHMDELTNGDAR